MAGMAHPAPLPAALRAGYARFLSDRYPADARRYLELAASGQRPNTLIVACSDSRSAPEAIFDARPGELFVVRNVAGLVPTYAPDAAAHGASAALEYGVLALGVSSIVVLGHGRCGGIGAALAEEAPLSTTDFLGTWVRDVRVLAQDPAILATPGPNERRLALERRSVEASLDRLRTFPWIRSREVAGALALHGAWFDIELGELHELGSKGWAQVGARLDSGLAAGEDRDADRDHPDPDELDPLQALAEDEEGRDRGNGGELRREHGRGGDAVLRGNDVEAAAERLQDA
jgi:carbonic anhydrase